MPEEDVTRMEYLDAGPAGAKHVDAPPAAAKRSRGWIPYVAGAVTFVVVLVGLGALVGDWVARNYEMRELVSQIEVSEAAMTQLQTNVQDIFGEFEGSDPLTDEDRTALNAELAAAAKAGHDAIEAAADRVQDVRWLKWHREVRDAQAAYLTHNRAWQAYLGRASSDPAEFGVQQEDVNTTFEAAENPIRDAIPKPALFDLLNRVELIFAPPPPADGQTQDA